MPEATAQETATAGTGGAEQGTTQEDMIFTIDDVIIDINESRESGNILYLVITSIFEEGERWIPVPISMFQWVSRITGSS